MKVKKTVATVGNLGYLSFAPGTLGSLIGLLLIWGLSDASLHKQLAGCAAVVALALWSAGKAARAIGYPDPPQIIIDEVAGMMVAVVALPYTWHVMLIGFIAFRLLDILKPFPIKQIQRLPGTWGIVLDDLAAGLATQVGLRFLLHFFR